MNQTRWPSRILCLCGSAIWTLDHTWYSTHPVDRWCKSFTPHKNGKICDRNHKSILDCVGAEESFGALSDSASQYGCLGEQSGTLSRKGNTSKPAMDLEDISGIFFTKRKWWWIEMLMIFHQYQCMIVDVGINRNRNPGDDIDTMFSEQSDHLCSSATKTPDASDTPWPCSWFSGYILHFAGWSPILSHFMNLKFWFFVCQTSMLVGVDKKHTIFCCYQHFHEIFKTFFLLPNISKLLWLVEISPFQNFPISIPSISLL